MYAANPNPEFERWLREGGYNKLTAFVRRVLRGSATIDAEDVVQETILSVLKKLRTVDSSALKNLGAWLRAVARRHAIDLLRKQARHKRQLEDKFADCPADLLELSPDFIRKAATVARRDRVEFSTRRRSTSSAKMAVPKTVNLVLRI